MARSVSLEAAATQSIQDPCRALVLGGAGVLGAAGVAALARAGVSGVLTYLRSRERAEHLGQEHGYQALKLDLRDPLAIRDTLAVLAEGDHAPDVIVHCAAVARFQSLADLSIDAWDTTQAINSRAQVLVCQALLASMAARGRGDIVLVGAWSPDQALRLPIASAASQGALVTSAMALSQELGPLGIRVNILAFGPLGRGLSAGLDAELLAAYRSFSALARTRSVVEYARMVAWLALENSYINGQIIPFNGGV